MRVCVCEFMTLVCRFFSSFVWWRVRIEPLCQFVVGTTIFKAPSCKVVSRACNHGLHITCRDGSWRSRSKVSHVYAKHLSFYNTYAETRAETPSSLFIWRWSSLSQA